MEHWPVLGSNRKFIEISDKLLLKEFVQPNGCGFGALAIRQNYWPPTFMCLEQEKDSKRLAVWKWKEARSLSSDRKRPSKNQVSEFLVSRSPFFGPSNFSWTFSQLKKWTTPRILGMSWGVKNTFFEAPGMSLGGSGVSIGGVKILRASFVLRP